MSDTDDYHHRLTNALMKAIFETSLVEIDGEQRAMIHTPQVCEALCVVLATMIETSPTANTPRAMRLLADEVGKNVHAAMRNLRKERDAGGQMPITTEGHTLN